jgi:hypothetical protein
MSAEDAYTPFNDEFDEIINATPERAAAVAEIRAEMDHADRAKRIEIDLATAAEHETPAA